MIKFLEKEQSWKDESTTYWFSQDGKEFGVVECGDHRMLVDHDQKPIIRNYTNDGDLLLPMKCEKIFK